MQLDTGQRTFYVGASGILGRGGGERIDVPFLDSAGNNIKCNYFHITFANGTTGGAGTNNGYFVAELSGVEMDGGQIPNISVVQPYANMESSGILGIGGVIGNSVILNEMTRYTWHGSNGQVATGLRIVVKNSLATANIAFGITYGNLFPLNSRRLEQSYDAGV